MLTERYGRAAGGLPPKLLSLVVAYGAPWQKFLFLKRFPGQPSTAPLLPH